MDEMHFDITSEPCLRALFKLFAELDEKDAVELFMPGHRFVLENGENKIMYVALDPRQKPPEHGLFQHWISMDDQLPPEIPGEYLVRVRSGGPPYGDWEYNYDIGYWNEYWDKDGKHGFDFISIICDWDGDVKITHWMPIPEPPEY